MLLDIDLFRICRLEDFSMRKTLLASIAVLAALSITTANAADKKKAAPKKAKPTAAASSPVAAPQSSKWTGFYVGVYGGYSFANDTRANVGTKNFKFNGADGFIGGLQAGYDHQVDSYVIGAAGDFGYNGVSKSWMNPTNDYKNKVEGNYSGSLRARAGYLVTNDLLVYATSGWAFISVKLSGDDVPSVGDLKTQTKTLNGYTVGAGIEYKITSNVSINTEYRYSDYQKASVNNFGAAKAGLTSQDVRLGINYRF
jgi:outer membrane immunogenic protein